MRIVVISDTHGRWERAEAAVRCQSKAEIIIFLGDGAEDVDSLQYESGKMLLAVRGNCDFASELPALDEFTVEGKKIFFTHGHLFDVKYGTEKLVEAGRRRGADIILFGHTHKPVAEYVDEMYIMNPGSLGHPCDGNPTYGIIDITKAGIVTNIVKLKI